MRMEKSRYSRSCGERTLACPLHDALALPAFIMNWKTMTTVAKQKENVKSAIQCRRISKLFFRRKWSENRKIYNYNNPALRDRNARNKLVPQIQPNDRKQNRGSVGLWQTDVFILHPKKSDIRGRRMTARSSSHSPSPLWNGDKSTDASRQTRPSSDSRAGQWSADN